MDIQAAPPTYAPADGVRTPVGNPPVLGQQVPGFSGGLPSQGGLSVLANPMAQQLQSQGRGEDTMLVHMTPGEVNSLQGLAMAHGGSLTINPNTGLPEAGILGKLLPTLLGVGLNFAIPGLGIAIKGLSTAAQAGLMTGLGGIALTGSLKKGLMAGMQAFGGASLAGGVQGALKGAAVPGTTQSAALGNTTLQGAPSIVQSAAPEVMKVSAFNPATAFSGAGQGLATSTAMLPGSTAALTAPIANAATGVAEQIAQPVLKKGLAGFTQGFANAAKGNMTGLLGKAAVPLAASGALQGISGAFAPSGGSYNTSGRPDNSYAGPYVAQQRKATFAPTTQELLASSKERDYFDVDVPEISNVQGQIVQPGSSTAPGTPILQNYLLPGTGKEKDTTPLYGQRYVSYLGDQTEGMAKGGEIQLSDGAFVVDARTVSELGNGSSGAGQELLARMGGRPVRGPGDGVSDSIPARIGRDQPARVARDEVVFSPEAVSRLGKGNRKKGAQKLYALMDKAHKARKKSERGKDTKLRKGLA